MGFLMRLGLFVLCAGCLAMASSHDMFARYQEHFEDKVVKFDEETKTASSTVTSIANASTTNSTIAGSKTGASSASQSTSSSTFAITSSGSTSTGSTSTPGSITLGPTGESAFNTTAQGGLFTPTSSQRGASTSQAVSTIPTVATTTVPKPLSCVNGGFAQNNKCTCPNYFQGDNCEKIVCINGGYEHSSVKDRCVCPPGFFGTHCDSVTELPSPQTGFPLVDDTFNLYAYNEISLYNGAVALIEFVKAVEKDVHVQKDYKAYNYWHYTENKHGENATAAPEASMTHTTKWDDFKKALEATTFADPNYDCSPVNLYQNLLDLIQQQKLTSTTVTVFTQFPGHSHWIIYQRLLATAAAFRIRFNFLVTDDPLLLSCNFTSDEFVAMKNLAINTGGSFVLLNDQTAQFGIAPVIQMHYQTQLVAFTSKDDCSSVPFSFITDFDTMTYTIIVNTLDQSGSMTCEGCDQLGNGTQNSRFYAKELGLNVPQDMTLKFRGPCTVQVLTDKASVRLFQSFVPKNSGLDSAYIQPVIGVPSTIRIHAQMDNQPIIQNTVATQIQIGSETINASAASTFSFAVPEEINCGSAQKSHSWTQVTVTTLAQFTFQRYLPFNCFDTTPDFPETTLAPSSIPASTVGGSSMVSKVSTTSETARTAPAAGEIPRWHILEGEATSSSSTSSTTVSGSTASASTSAASSTTIGPTTASTSASITSGATESSTSSFSTVSGSTKVSTTPASTVSGATVPLSTLGSVSTIRISSTLAPTTTTEVPCTNETLPTLFIAISCTIGVQQVDAFAEGAVNVDTARLADSYSKYQLVIYDIEGTKDPLYTSYTDPTSFMNGISITIPDTCKQTPKQNKTDISGIMQKYVVEAKLKDSAMILVVPSDDAGTFDEKTLQHLATNRDLVFGIIQSTQAPVVADDSSLALAATVTGGQIFGTINDDDSAQQITAYLLATLGPQKPVSVATVTNLAMGENIGYVNVDGRKDVTFEVTVTGMQNELVFLTIGDQEVSIVPDDIPSKNFNTTTIVVNKSGPISITVMNSQKTYNLYVRVWEVPDKAVNLVVDQSTDAGSGASVKTLLAFEEISKATVTFFDCNGLNSTISDTTQVAGVGPWNISQTRCGEEIDFVPFLCQSGQKNCLVPGSEDLYSYKVVTEHDEGSFQFWGSFMCPKPAITACQNGGTLGNGACKCKPEYTGPECQLPNCNGNGYLYFDDGPKCSCNDGFSGDFCDISECALNETISAALFDPTIRVLTVVMLYNDADDLKTLYENTKKTLPSKMTAEAIRNIFKYVFYAQNAEQKDVLSVGQSLDTTSIDIPKLLGNSSDEIAFEDVVSQALKVTGRQQRGLLWVTVSDIVSLKINADAFYQAVAGYRQEVFVSVFGTAKPDAHESLSQALLVTGGQLMVYDTSKDKSIDNTILTAILSGSPSLTFYPESTKLSSTKGASILKDQFVIISANKKAGEIDSICADLSSRSTYTCSGKASKDIVIPANFAPFVSARDTSDVGLSWTFVATAQDSDWTAVPSNLTLATNMIVHTVHAEVDNANKPGFVKRGAGCAIQAVFVVDTTSVGYNQITVPLKGKLPRIVPFGVISGQPSCQNGAQGKNGACMCAGHWTGADCSIPVCQNQGVLNTQASACHCNESEFYGLACENSKLSNFWLH